MDYKRTSVFPHCGREELFEYHARPGAFERLTPPQSGVRLIEKRGTIRDGDRLTFRMGPFTWVAEHYGYRKGTEFCDRQIQGPFRKWEHQHLFYEGKIEDVIHYEMFMGWLFQPFIRRGLDRLFEYRHKVLERDIPYFRKRSQKPMRILIAGSTGLVGSHLVPFLQAAGHDVVRLVRPGSKENGIVWDPNKGEVDLSRLEGFDAVVNLSGENIGDSRWTDAKKEKILNSRIKTTRLLAESFAKLKNPPKVWVNASAVGYYGSVKDQEVTETHEQGEGFLAEVCRQWEEATEPALKLPMRIVLLRTGMVVSSKGGAVGGMILPFKLCLGGKLGSGTQEMSWIDIEDLSRVILHCLETESIHGPVNAVAPHPVTNYEFTKTMGKVLGRPTFFSAPAFLLRWALGDMADELLLSGAEVIPDKLNKTGFEFAYPTLESSLRHQL